MCEEEFFQLQTMSYVIVGVESHYQSKFCCQSFDISCLTSIFNLHFEHENPAHKKWVEVCKLYYDNNSHTIFFNA